MSEQPVVPGGERLESWKAIATFLNRDVRTVMRWEKSEGLPVHRQRHLSRSSVYAFPHELDAWRSNRRAEPAAMPPQHRLRPFVVAATLAIGILSGGGGQFNGPLTATQAGQTDRLLNWPSDPSFDYDDESMSPDGRYVAYTDATGEVAIRDLRGGRTRVLTKMGRAGAHIGYLQISNDSKLIAFYAESKTQKAGIWLLPIDATEGAEPRRVADAAIPLQWSADDRQIVGTIDHDRGNDIMLVDVQTGTSKVLTFVPYPGVGDKVALSPDGRFIAYDQRAEPNRRQRDLRVLAVDTGVTTPLLADPTNDSMIAWSPDGRFVVFSSDRAGSQGEGLWALPVRAGIASGDPVLLKADFRGYPVTLTHAGALLFEQEHKVNDLLIGSLNVDSGTVTPAPQAASHDPRALSTTPRWSGDGQRFFYQIKRQSGWVISMRSIKTSVVEEIPLELEYVASFDVSKDGRKIVCRGRNLENQAGIYLVDTTTGDFETVAIWKEGVVRQFIPQFTSDGKSVTYITGDYHGHNQYVERNLETGSERVIATPPTGIGNNLGRSPDGRYWLSYEPSATPAKIIFRVYDVVTAQVRVVFQDDRKPDFVDDGVQWMPDSRALIANVGGANGTVRELWWIPVDGRQPKRLTVGVNVVDAAIAIDPEGKQIAFGAGDPMPSKTADNHYQLRLLEHFLQETKGRF